MTSKTVSQLLCDLGVLQSHSRPHHSNDNPYSEAQFKTLKYFPAFPRCFANIEDARQFCAAFFEHYNLEHRHSGIGLNTPADVHFGRAGIVREKRQGTLDAACEAHPERFRKPPCAPRIPEAAWINRPEEPQLATSTI
jgi:putative transposase